MASRCVKKGDKMTLAELRGTLKTVEKLISQLEEEGETSQTEESLLIVEDDSPDIPDETSDKPDEDCKQIYFSIGKQSENCDDYNYIAHGVYNEFLDSAQSEVITQSSFADSA